MRPRFLVLLAAYNGMKWIEEQINSILNQDDVDVDIVVSIDKSTDGTELWIDELTKREARISALPHERKFGGAALNFFRLLSDVKFNDYDYVALSDQDDIWLPGKLHRAHVVMCASESDGYSSDVIAFWPDGREKMVIKSQPQVDYDYLFEAAGPGCTYVLKMSLANAFKAHIQSRTYLVQGIALHDWYLYAFSRSRSYRWIIDSVPGIRYRQHSNNQFGANSGVKALKLRIEKVLDGWWLNQSRLTVHALDVRSDSVVDELLRKDRWGALMLALQGRKCRRRTRDKFAFTGLCLLLSIVGQKK